MTKYIDCEPLINEFSGGESVKSITESIADERFVEALKNAPAADVVEVKHGKWETVHGVLTPGGDPLKRCPYCKSRESEHLDGVEHPSRWMFCPICGTKMDLKEGIDNA